MFEFISTILVKETFKLNLNDNHITTTLFVRVVVFFKKKYQFQNKPKPNI